jgi:hypothetical protein
MLKQKIVKQQEESLLHRQLALGETVKQQSELLKKQSEDITCLMALIQQPQQPNLNTFVLLINIVYHLLFFFFLRYALIIFFFTLKMVNML